MRSGGERFGPLTVTGDPALRYESGAEGTGAVSAAVRLDTVQPLTTCPRVAAISAALKRLTPPKALSAVPVVTEPVAVVVVLVTSVSAKLASTISPPASSLASEAALNWGSEQALWPLAAMGTTTALLRDPPALTWTLAKQSGAMSEGSVKLICHNPG